MNAKAQHVPSQPEVNRQAPPLAEHASFDLERETFSANEPLSDDAWLNQMLGEGVDPMVAKGYLKHRRDLLSLLPQHRGEWAAYHGNERLQIAPSKTRLYRKYLDLRAAGIGAPRSSNRSGYVSRCRDTRSRDLTLRRLCPGSDRRENNWLLLCRQF